MATPDQQITLTKGDSFDGGIVGYNAQTGKPLADGETTSVALNGPYAYHPATGAQSSSAIQPTSAPNKTDAVGSPVNSVPSPNGTLLAGVNASSYLPRAVTSSDIAATQPQTPTAPTTPTTTAPVSAAQAYLNNFQNPSSEKDNYDTLLNQSQGMIDAITKASKDAEAEARAGTSGVLAAAGLSGSSSGAGATNEAIQPILDKRASDLATVYQNIMDSAQQLTASQQAAAQSTAESDVANAKDTAATALANGTNAIKVMAAAHVDWQNFKTSDPATYKSLVQSVGGDPNVADALFAASAPAENVVQTWNTSDGSGGTTINQLVQDPITGKQQVVKYDVPGMVIPQNWTNTKIGTNSTLYTSPAFQSDPSNPANWMTISTDPTNNGAITVVANGVTTVNGIPVDTSSDATATAGPASTYNPPSSAYASKVINDTATFSGVTDITQSMTDIVANANIGVTGVVNGLIKQEGGSPQGVVNNPGNVEFANQTGATDSGVPIQGGGGATFASFGTKDQGTAAVASLVQNAADKGESFQQFVTAYKGLGSSTDSTSYDVNSGVPPTDAQSSQNYVAKTSAGAPVDTGVSNNAIWQAGVELATTGKAPSLGMGGSATDIKSIRKGVNDAAAAYAKSLGTDYPTLQEQFSFAKNNTTQSVIANANTVVNSISDPTNGLIALSANVPRDNLQIKNGVAIAVGEGTSDSATVDFVNKINSTADELGKIFGSGAGSDFTTQLAQSLINPNLSQQAFASSMQTILGSVQNKVNAYLEQGGGTIGGTDTNTENSDVETAQAGASGTLGNGTTVTKASDGNWYDSQGNAYDSNGNPIQ